MQAQLATQTWKLPCYCSLPIMWLFHLPHESTYRMLWCECIGLLFDKASDSIASGPCHPSCWNPTLYLELCFVSILLELESMDLCFPRFSSSCICTICPSETSLSNSGPWTQEQVRRALLIVNLYNSISVSTTSMTTPQWTPSHALVIDYVNDRDGTASLTTKWLSDIFWGTTTLEVQN